LVWCYWQDTGKVADQLAPHTEGWAEVLRAPFTPLGGDVVEL
jgi:hypothetical protein